MVSSTVLFLLVISFTGIIERSSQFNLKQHSYRQNAHPEGRLINGENAENAEAPFIVSLRRNNEHFCAGSIISPHWVITSAHCLNGTNDHIDFDVIAGLYKLDEALSGQKYQIRKINSTRSLFIHPEYIRRILKNDIGLIHFDEPFILNKDGNTPKVDSISLPTSDYRTDVKSAKLYGWGLTDDDGHQSNILQVSTLDIISFENCVAAYPPGLPLATSILCTLTPGTVNGPCDTDSGGPLVQNTINGVELIGIVSWAPQPCTTRTYPSVFSRVEAFQSWINSTIRAL